VVELRDSQPSSQAVDARAFAKASPFLSRHFAVFAVPVLFALTFLVYYFTGEGKATQLDYFVPLADGFLHGRLSILHPQPGLLDELIPARDGGFYVIYPPMPAILLLPEVAIWGFKTNQTLASVCFGSLNVPLVFLLMRRITTSLHLQLWMTFLFAFGTVHWFLASTGPAWYLAHVVSFLFLALAIYATLSNQRPLLIGLLLGASYWTRLPTILSLPFFVIMLADRWLGNSSRSSLVGRIRFKPLFELGAGVAIFVLADALYNYERFGTPRDIAYSIQARRETYLYPAGLLDISYLPKHLWVLFLKPPVFTYRPPYVMPSALGLSILITTPAVVYCLFAGLNRLAVACWSAIVPVALLDFIHGGTGWVQFGYRFGMDFYPFLLVLTALGIGACSGPAGNVPRKAQLLIVLSILVNLWGVLWINKFGWVSDLTCATC